MNLDYIIEAIAQACVAWKGVAPEGIDKLPASGSNRIYCRVTIEEASYIAAYNTNIKENETFVYFTNHFKSLGLAVPSVYFVNSANTVYIQEDLGDDTLLSVLEKEGYSERCYGLFQKSLAALAQLQIVGGSTLDYSKCITAKEFGKQAILSDLLYFKYYFLDTLEIAYDKQALLDDFEALASYLTHAEEKHFMFRDFQSRNIMVKGDEVYCIDYQGGMKGALQYDVASLLWQAKAQLSEAWKQNLLNDYIGYADALLAKPLDKARFISQYNGYVLIRLLQVLGAYGFRGLFERKAHFLTSIPLALKNLKYFIAQQQIGISTLEFEKILGQITEDSIIDRFNPPKATETTKLMISINSFSYKKGIPKDETENGGGFVFDMRGILNPGRFDAYKHLSGLDKPVQDFLEQKTKMSKFLNSVWDVVDVTVEDYLQRDFEHLQINFGCTGGQHRSVYAAEQTARHLKNKYHLKVVHTHTNKANWLVQP